MKTRTEEHFIERLNRLGIEYEIVEEDEKSFTYRSKTNGRWDRSRYKMDNPVTNLLTCCYCGKTSTPKKIQSRGDVWNWNQPIQLKYDPFIENKTLLCMGCYNKIKVISKKRDEIIEIIKLSNKIRNEAKKQKRQLAPHLPTAKEP